MKYVDEYRDANVAQGYAQAIARIATKPWTIMEVCGGQTHAIVKYGVDELLPKNITLLHGPGCPVCVTPGELIGKAIAIALLPDVIFCSFGDMLRVPVANSNGNLLRTCSRDLLSVKATGGDVRIVYSPMDALDLALKNPKKQVVFFAVGFETTAPANAMAVFQAHQQEVKNFSILISHVLVPPAVELILSSSNNVQGLLAAGHVCTIMGYTEYEPIAAKFKIPIVVTGFEPTDLLQGIYLCVKQLEEGRVEVENQYTRSVSREGNLQAQKLMKEVFCVVHRQWRGIGKIPMSGLGLSDKYRDYDAEKRFGVTEIYSPETSECISGLVLQGIKKPQECPAFGTRCTPEQPKGATMVSSEGACSAYYLYRGDRP